MSKCHVTRLTSSDLSRFRELNALFAEAFDDAESYDAKPPDDAYAARVLAKDHVIALVAIADDAVVGGLVAYELDKLEQARSEMYLYDLAVAESWRRRHVATQLIGTLQRLAAERGAWVVYVQADLGDDPAVALYTGLGVREDVLHFDLPVQSGSAAKSNDPSEVPETGSARPHARPAPARYFFTILFGPSGPRDVSWLACRYSPRCWEKGPVDSDTVRPRRT